MANEQRERLPLTETQTPTEQTAVTEIVQQAAQRGTPVYPIGGGTSLDYGVFPQDRGVGLSLSCLNRVIDYPARDLTITVEAGMTVAALAKRLAAEGQRLPIDVPRAEHATVGGVVVSCPAGPRQYRWGTIRDYVIGLRAVDGCGTAFSAGGRVVKNAAGYDLCRLMSGSLGTLGVLVQVTLMVKPLPEVSALVACPVANWETAERLLADLGSSKTLPSAVELLTGPAWQNFPSLGPLPGASIARLVVGLEGTQAEVDWMIGQLQDEWRKSGISSVHSLRGNEAAPVWECLIEFPSPAVSNGETPVVLQINVLPSKVIAAINELQRLEPTISVVAHAGSGMILAHLAPSDRLADVIDSQIRPQVSALGGCVTVLCQPPSVSLSRETIWGPLRDTHAVMQAIKDQFDPKHILNRGRFLFAPSRS